MKIRFVGYYQRFDKTEITNGDTLYGNYLYYPLKKEERKEERREEKRRIERE